MKIRKRSQKTRLSLIFLFLLSLNIVAPSSACDSTILELLSGESSQQEITGLLLSLSKKMQQTANVLKSYNNAAASKLHLQIMEDWLKISSKITANAHTLTPTYPQFSNFLMQVARDLGQVRRKLEDKRLDYIHEILESCITRMSLISAMINGKQRIVRFLEAELLIYNLRPFFGDLVTLKKKMSNSNLTLKLEQIGKNVSPEASQMIPALSKFYEIFRESIEQEKIEISMGTMAIFQNFLNNFIKFKRKLLNESYFRGL